VRDFT